VNQLNDTCPADKGIGRRTAGSGGKGQKRTEAFAWVSKNIAYHRADFRFEDEFLRREEFLERREMGFKASVQRGGHAAMCG
jgi:hypothetical protein